MSHGIDDRKEFVAPRRIEPAVQAAGDVVVQGLRGGPEAVKLEPHVPR